MRSERTGANGCPDSTSWGSLVRAQCRPLRKALLRQPFFVLGLEPPGAELARGTKMATTSRRMYHGAPHESPLP
jgi:hypothetical protein